jgi:hypothetical protein
MIKSIIEKHLTEGSLKTDVKSLKNIISKGKNAKFELKGKTIKVTNAAGMLIFEYPSDMYELTMNLIEASDALGKKYQQIGLRSGNTVKFIIEL